MKEIREALMDKFEEAALAKLNDDPVLGRLALWCHSLEKVINMLVIAEKSFRKWDELLVSIGEKAEYADHSQIFNGDDFYDIAHAAVDIASIYFWHVFGTEVGCKEGRVAQNQTKEMEQIRGRMKFKIFESIIDKKRFNEMKRIIEENRNKYVAHSDGSYFDIITFDWARNPGVTTKSSLSINVLCDEELLGEWLEVSKMMKSFVEEEMASRIADASGSDCSAAEL